MAYIPANPHFAVVNVKIGDLNLTPIPPNSLESFTFERDTNQGAGNKFTIVVHDETAIIMESYLAEVAHKAMQSQSYEFESELPNIYNEDGTLKDEEKSDDVNKKETSETKKPGDSTSSEGGSEPSAAMLMAASLDDEQPIYEVPTAYADFVSVSEEPLDDDGSPLIVRDGTNLNALKVRGIRDNSVPFSSVDGDTTLIMGTTGRNVTETSSTVYRENYVPPNIIDNSKLVYADPAEGIHEIYGVTIPENVWMDPEGALKEHSGGKGDD